MIDLRSDTLTLPTKDMLATILNAQFGDDGRTDSAGRGEDPTVNELEDYAAALLERESAVLFSSGTLANTAALLTHCAPGDKVLIDPVIHMYYSEKAAFSGRFGQLEPVFYQLNAQHKPDLQDIESKLQAGGTSLICIENSHNFTGGTCLNAAQTKAICDLAHRFNVPVHLDGARLFNAAASTGDSAAQLVKHVDSVMFCLSKGLGAPMGSLLLGSGDFIRKARNTRRLLGGGMRQAGVFAAPGLYALKHNIPRLKEDNLNARLFAKACGQLQYIQVQQQIDSNIVMLNAGATGLTPQQFCAEALQRGLYIRPILQNDVRLVFYNAITGEDAENAAKIIRSMDQTF